MVACRSGVGDLKDQLKELARAGIVFCGDVVAEVDRIFSRIVGRDGCGVALGCKGWGICHVGKLQRRLVPAHVQNARNVAAVSRCGNGNLDGFARL